MKDFLEHEIHLILRLRIRRNAGISRLFVRSIYVPWALRADLNLRVSKEKSERVSMLSLVRLSAIIFERIPIEKIHRS